MSYTYHSSCHPHCAIYLSQLLSPILYHILITAPVTHMVPYTYHSSCHPHCAIYLSQLLSPTQYHILITAPVTHIVPYRWFPTKIVYLYYISCLRYTILVWNSRYTYHSSCHRSCLPHGTIYTYHCSCHPHDTIYLSQFLSPTMHHIYLSQLLSPT